MRLFKILIVIVLLFTFFISGFAQETEADNSYPEVYLGYGWNKNDEAYNWIGGGIMAVERFHKFYSFFTDVSVYAGLNDAKECYLVSLAPGLRWNFDDGKSDFQWFIDLEVGPGAIKTKDNENLLMGVTTAVRTGFGYSGFIIDLGARYFGGINGAFVFTSLSLRYRF